MLSRSATPRIRLLRGGPVLAGASRATAQGDRIPRRGGNFLGEADPEGLADLDDVRLSSPFEPGQEVGDVAVAAIGCHYGMLYPGLAGTIKQGQGQLGLG